MSETARTPFPVDKPFEKQAADSDLAQVVFPLVVGFNSPNAYIVGTATVLCGHLAVTAKHVIDEIMKAEQHDWADPAPVENSLCALQIVPGPEYQLWPVIRGWGCPQTDVAFLQLASSLQHSGNNPVTTWLQPPVRALPPAIGERVVAFGYRKSIVAVSRNADGGFHHDVGGELMASIGAVREVYEKRRDSVLLPFPCYQVSARFDGGMSGGPVFDEYGAMCGLVCAGVDGAHEDGEPISYVSTLWPIFQTVIAADCAGYGSGERYPAIELVHRSLVYVTDYIDLMRQLS